MTFTLRPHQKDMIDSMESNDRGIIQCPTGGGKTYTFITNSRQYLTPGNVVLVVAPQLLLSQQLFDEFDTHLTDIDFVWRQISSEGKTFQRDRKNLKFRPIPPHSATTIVDEIVESYDHSIRVGKPLILFTTYKSLDRVVSSGIPISVVYYDEAHNATATDNFNAVKDMGVNALKSYFFTATPKFSKDGGSLGSGMNNTEVYGELICKVKFNTLVEQGVIVRPRLRLIQSTADLDETCELNTNISTMKEIVTKADTIKDTPKILFCAQGTKAIGDILSSNFVQWAFDRGYNVLSIDSNNQGYINGERGISKAKFLTQLNKLGNDPSAKLIVMHYSMLGEGIDVKSFTSIAFLRKSMGDIFATQSIGRVIRSAPGKTHGDVIVVQHSSDTDNVRSLICDIVRSLIESGVPPESFLNEEDGRGKEEEIVEDLPEEIVKAVKDAAIDYQWSSMLSALTGVDTADLDW